ncbi:hypothetical protein [Sediminitomix flava]|uniref:Uncharacterized protein n=1 Tax=Sediminitomix flava TaxID=379075 RepID=A0A315ZEA3_SEDFL|nr:hypothetical protein [Sediminitomix flava]PWJ43064.1 hypothetical protein BC781_102612 [Sediminitomix flava]
MKTKYISLVAFFAMSALFGCDPMEDIKDELDIQSEENTKATEYKYARDLAPDSYTLTDEDYALSSNENVQKYKNFSSSALPEEFLPEILNKRFYGNADQELSVTYDFYSSVSKDKENAYELSPDDYSRMGESYSNFSSIDEAEFKLPVFLTDKAAYEDWWETGSEQTVMYTVYGNRDVRFFSVTAEGETELLDYAPSDTVTFTDEMYDLLPVSEKYNNFSNLDDAHEGISSLVLDHGYAAGNYACIVFTNDYYFVARFDGQAWGEATSVGAVTEVLSFIENKEDFTASTWEADNAIKLTLGSADYDLSDATSQYQNFDTRANDVSPKNEAELVEMIGYILDTNYDATDDQPYIVTYAYYNGSNGIDKIRVIRVGGVWQEDVK